MNGPSTVNQSTNNNNEQLIGKFHVVNVDKLPTNPVNSHEETTTTTTNTNSMSGQPASSAATDESTCASRFQMIRVDRNFGRGRWKVNDYEPPENISNSTNPPVNNTENEPVNISNSTTLTTIPTALSTNAPPNLLNELNPTSSATLAATAASAAAAAATAFQQQQQQQHHQQQQQQQRLAMNNSAAMVPPGNVQPPAGLLHPYPPPTMANMGAPNQPYMLNHPQFGYYPYFPPPYSPYAAQWASMVAANPYLQAIMPSLQQQTSQLPTGNLGDPLRLTDADVTSENPVIASNPFPNVTNDPLQNAQMAAAAAPFLYAAHHPHSTYVTQPPPPNSASPYATIASYHPGPAPPTIIPPPTHPLSLAGLVPNNNTDIQQQQQQQSHQVPASQQQPPILTSPKHEVSATKNPVQQSTVSKPTVTTTPVRPQTTLPNGVNTDTLKTTTTTAITNPTHITDLLSSSPSIPNSQQQPPPSLLSPITVQTTNPNNPNNAPTASLTDIWSYASAGSPLNLSQTAAQTAAVTAVAAMGLLNHENTQNTEIANEILKELTTPTKQNNSTFSLSERRARLRYRRQRSTADIDNKISAAMDLVKMHLLSAVREEVTELRQQIRTLTDKVNVAEHENAFLRQHVPSEIFAQYTPLAVGSTAVNDPLNPSTTVSTTAPIIPPSSVSSSQPIPMASLSSLPPSVSQQQSTTSHPVTAPPASLTNLPQT